MSDRTPYTYFVLHIPTGLKYYGSKYGKGADPKTFWKPGGYFTSSVKVKKLLEDYGSDTFRAEVRKTFMSPDQALKYEYKFLHKVKALTKDDWLNDNYGGEKFRNYGPANAKTLLAQRNKKQSPESNIKRSNSLKGRIISDETRQKMSEMQKTRPREKEEERRSKIRNKALGRGHSDETKSKLSEIFSGTKWINNGTHQKAIDPSNLDQYLSEGWKLGRILTIVTCPHCGKSGVKHNIVRRHFDKCTSRKI
jgi:hypothetical protein